MNIFGVNPDMLVLSPSSEVLNFVSAILYSKSTISVHDAEPPKKKVDRFTSWSEWTECSKTCGGGSQARSRKCLIDETGGASNCRGGLVELRNCNSQPCPGMISVCDDECKSWI